MRPVRFLKIIKRCYTATHKSVDQPTAEMTKLVAIEKFQQKAIRVAVLGTDIPAGEYLAFLLKQNPLVSHLFLLGERANAVAADLECIDTRTMVTGFHENDVEKAVRRAEVVIMLGLDKNPTKEYSPQERFNQEYERVIKMTRICTMYSPKAVMLICVNPVSYTVPLVAQVFKRTHWYHPGRIIGSVAAHQVRLNTLLAEHNNLDPAGVNVPVIGGPDVDCIVPLFSRATPIGVTQQDAEKLTKKFRGIPDCEPVMFERQKFTLECSGLTQAYAVNRSVTSMALGLLGDTKTNMAGFIRSNILPTSKHITSTILVGHGGVLHNYGIPMLTKMELKLFERSLLDLKDREDQAAQALLNVSEKKLALMAA